MPLHFLHVQNLTAEGQDGLGVTVAALLGRTTCRVTLDEEDFALLRVFVRAVGELTGQSTTRHGVLALHTLAGLTGGDTCGGGEDDLLANLLGFLRMLLKIVGEGFANGLLHGTGYFRVAEFRLRLTFKLWLGNLDGDDGGEAFTEVFTGDFYLGLLDVLRDDGVGIGIGLQRARQGHAETREMGTAFDGVDVVDVGVDVLRVIGVIHDGNLDGDALFFGLQIDDVVEEVGAVTVYVAHELFQSVLGMEHFLTGLSVFVGAQVGKCNLDAGIEEGQFAHTTGNDVPLIVGGGEDGGVWPELLARTAQGGLADDLHGIEGLALLVFLLIDFSVAIDLRCHVARQGIDARDTDAVETAGNLIRAFIELTAGMEDGHDDFESRLVHLLVLVDGDASAVVLYGDRFVFVDGYFDVGAIAGHSLVDRVVDGFVDQVVETFLRDVTDIHGRAFAHGLESFQNLNVTGGIVVCALIIFCHFYCILK